MGAERSDAFVFFGATGDLAFKQIFPALHGLISDDGFDLPIIGVARSDISTPIRRSRGVEALPVPTASGMLRALSPYFLTSLSYVALPSPFITC
jgi:glucose-6-phosphate 1-dehydrogenase